MKEIRVLQKHIKNNFLQIRVKKYIEFLSFSLEKNLLKGCGLKISFFILNYDMSRTKF